MDARSLRKDSSVLIGDEGWEHVARGREEHWPDLEPMEQRSSIVSLSQGTSQEVPPEHKSDP